MVNAVICGKKLKCAHAMGNNLVFYFGLNCSDVVSKFKMRRPVCAQSNYILKRVFYILVA